MKFFFVEMQPQWFDMSKIPYDQMWADDKHWWPYFIRNETFEAYFKFQGFETILEKRITPGAIMN